MLSARNIWKSYGGVQALRGADFSLNQGEVHALMGENGAGKSTLAKIIAGVIMPDNGAISLNGQDRAASSPLEAQRRGISMIHQELDLFPDLSIAENIVIGNQSFAEGRLVNRTRMEQFAENSLRQVGLSAAPQRRVSTLSIGDMQLVMIARALSMRARIIIMDEPTSSLFHDSAERLFGLIERLSNQGVSVIYVSHKMDEIFRICHRMTVMRDGVTIGTRRREEASVHDLISMMVGREWNPAGSDRRIPTEQVLLSVAGLTTHKLHDISFDLHAGEVLGLAGLVGSGLTELGHALAGLNRLQAGSINLGSSNSAIRLLPEDRKLDGLMMQMSALENATIADLSKLATAGFTNRSTEERAIGPFFSQIKLRCSSIGDPVDSLSGGNQQKVLLARCLLSDPDILFLDDPTRGIDVGAKEDIYAAIDELAARGKGVVFVSSELPELLRCCDRILVMRNGRITADLDPKKTSQEEIMGYATNPVNRPGEFCPN